MLERAIGQRRVRVVRGDITDIEVDAFVYDITADLKLGSGFGGAIAQRGGQAIQKELNQLGSCPVGQAVMTGAGDMKARHIIHVNGPKFHEPGTEAKLESAIESALRIADRAKLRSVAIPPVGSGLYQVPLDVSARVIVRTVVRALGNGSESLEQVWLVGLDEREVRSWEAAVEQGA